MVKYAENELFSITDFTKQISSLVREVKNNSIEKIGVLKNNRLEVVVLSTEEYSRLKGLEQKVIDIEHEQIARIVQERKNIDISEYISMEEMAKKFDINLKTIVNVYD